MSMRVVSAMATSSKLSWCKSVLVGGSGGRSHGSHVWREAQRRTAVSRRIDEQCSISLRCYRDTTTQRCVMVASIDGWSDRLHQIVDESVRLRLGVFQPVGRSPYRSQGHMTAT